MSFPGTELPVSQSKVSLSPTRPICGVSRATHMDGTYKPSCSLSFVQRPWDTAEWPPGRRLRERRHHL